MTKQSTARTRVKMVCHHCGSRNVKADAWATWNERTQAWELAQVFDNAFCADCDGETQIDSRPC